LWHYNQPAIVIYDALRDDGEQLGAVTIDDPEIVERPGSKGTIEEVSIAAISDSPYSVREPNDADHKQFVKLTRERGHLITFPIVRPIEREDTGEGRSKSVDDRFSIPAFANTGIGGAMAPLNKHPFDEWQSVLDVNLTGVFLTAREASRQMIDAGEGGTIVSTASIYGSVGSFAGTSTAYTAAKGGVVNLTREMAVSLAPHEIRVNAIAPGFVGTTLLDEGLVDVSEAEAEAFRDEIEERTLLSRLAEPEEMKAMAVYLASPASSYVTG
jgi:NAD(P)-dependent dehydrogenase (short-subunit alcohol dehydrogenase family)